MKTSIAQNIDTLGMLRAQIAELQNQAKDLENVIKDEGDGSYDGMYYHVTVSTSERTTVDWKGIATKLGASRQIITANSKVSTSTALRITARKKAAA